MIHILLSGCGGAMGRAITQAVAQREDVVIAAGIDPFASTDAFPFPIFSTADSVFVEKIDVIINFSHPSSVDSLSAYAVAQGIPLVEATTGLSPAQLDLLTERSQQIPLFYSANMSLGVNLLVELAKKAAQVLGDSFDIEIIEKHHNQKLDAPSGTALLLADAIRDELSPAPQYVYHREDKREKRSRNEIGIHSVRGGTIVGEHEIIFAGTDEVISLSHAASSKEVFATGALKAAIFLAGKEPGLYSMKDLIG